ncbi:NUDIX hydrolase [Carboxylicivirga marina]|uniref:NUDIX hydrolase n=1 Tax=Carboxylicivirga marina TaxID=2800988 RepID=A0ABS1HEL6_9BACT|nr:NUDIX domain-containing protein [Carboxylicivirga marina]MBK3516065.1 NUDIX hydrolase [Carboxylicivirga marina]
MTGTKAISNISIDCIIFSFHNDELHTLLLKWAAGKSRGEWALPGGYVNYDENIDAAASRVLKIHTGLDHVYLEQLKAFGDVNRYPKKRVITITYFSLVKYSDIKVEASESVYEVQWFPVKNHPELIFDHQEILQFGLNRLKQIVRHEPIGFKLLPLEFTLLQLQSLYEAILETKFDKPNFRRKLLKMKLLNDTGKKQENVSHRAANLYKFDLNIYEKLKDKGFTFDL